MQSSMVVAGMDALSTLRKHFDTSGKSAALFHHRAICKTPWPCPTTGPSARLQAKYPYPQLKLHRLVTAKGRLSRCRAARASDARARGDIDVNTVPDLNKAMALAATGQTKTATPKAAAAPRIKLLSHGFCIDHPDPELGEQLMADALGVADPAAIQARQKGFLTSRAISLQDSPTSCKSRSVHCANSRRCRTRSRQMFRVSLTCFTNRRTP